MQHQYENDSSTARVVKQSVAERPGQMRIDAEYEYGDGWRERRIRDNTYTHSRAVQQRGMEGYCIILW